MEKHKRIGPVLFHFHAEKQEHYEWKIEGEPRWKIAYMETGYDVHQAEFESRVVDSSIPGETITLLQRPVFRTYIRAAIRVEALEFEINYITRWRVPQ